MRISCFVNGKLFVMPGTCNSGLTWHKGNKLHVKHFIQT